MTSKQAPVSPTASNACTHECALPQAISHTREDATPTAPNDEPKVQRSIRRYKSTTFLITTLTVLVPSPKYQEHSIPVIIQFLKEMAKYSSTQNSGGAFYSSKTRSSNGHLHSALNHVKSHDSMTLIKTTEYYGFKLCTQGCGEQISPTTPRFLPQVAASSQLPQIP